jgi:hypothetical protein
VTLRWPQAAGIPNTRIVEATGGNNLNKRGGGRVMEGAFRRSTGGSGGKLVGGVEVHVRKIAKFNFNILVIFHERNVDGSCLA